MRKRELVFRRGFTAIMHDRLPMAARTSDGAAAIALQMTAATDDEKEEASSSTEDSKKKKPMKLLLVSPISALQAQ